MVGEEFYQQLDLVDPSYTIPLVWHADGVKIFRNQKAWVYSYSSMVKKSDLAVANKMVFLILKESHMSKPHSHNAVGKIIGYVCRVLATGCFPTLDISGQPFAEGSREFDLAGKPFASASTEGQCWRAAFCAWKGDLEARVQIHKLTRNYMANWICEHCAAGRLISFGDFSSTAAWKDARFNHQQFLMMTADNKRSAWLHVPGWTKDRNLDVPCSIFKLPAC